MRPAIHLAFKLPTPSAVHGVFEVTVGTIVALLLAGGGEAPPVIFAQLRIRQKVIIHIPAQQPRPGPMEWKEKNGPQCIPASALAGALISRQGIDLLLRGGRRVRAKLSRCPPLDYESGFYVRPGADGRVCEDRDTVRVRSGGSCEIDRFRMLVPAKRK
jgi:hypothetical protein